MKTKTPKPRVMWANYYTTEKFPCVHTLEGTAKYWSEGPRPVMTIRVAVIPLDDIESLVERAEEAFFDHEGINSGRSYRERIRAALTAAGIPCKQRRAKQ